MSEMLRKVIRRKHTTFVAHIIDAYEAIGTDIFIAYDPKLISVILNKTSPAQYAEIADGMDIAIPTLHSTIRRLKRHVRIAVHDSTT